MNSQNVFLHFKLRRITCVLAASVGLCAVVNSAPAATALKSGSGTDLTGATAGVWSGGGGANGSPTASDTATWNASSLGAGLTVGSDVSWLGISISGALSDVNISGAGVITLGAGGLTLSTNNLTIGNGINTTGGFVYRSLSAGTNTLATLNGPINNGAITLFSGRGKFILTSTSHPVSTYGIGINANATVEVADIAAIPTGIYTMFGNSTFRYTGPSASMAMFSEYYGWQALVNFDVASAGTTLTLTTGMSNYLTSGLQKIGAGTLELSGPNSYYSGGTTVSNGTLLISGSSVSAVSVNGGTLRGTGTVSGNVTVGSGGRLAAGTGSTTGQFTLAGSSIALGGQTYLRIAKNGGTPTSDNLNVTTAAPNFGGTLVITNITSDATPLANGDTFSIFTLIAPATGGFASFTLPSLSAGLTWDTSQLESSGIIKVVNTAPPPTFTPAAGGYVGAQVVTVSSTISGSTIYYTTDGSTPTAGSPSGITPVNVNVPLNTVNFTIKAFVRATGYADSTVGTAVYSTIQSPVWINPAGGTWENGSNWSNNVPANGTGVIADFTKVTLPGAATTVSVNVGHTVGSLLFGDLGATYDWAVSGSFPITLDNGAQTPVISNSTAPVAISAPLAGINGFIKNGSNVLTLSGANTYSGQTAINGGQLILNYAYANGATGPAISASPGTALSSVFNGVVTYQPVTLNGSTWTNGGQYYASTLTMLNGSTMTPLTGNIYTIYAGWWYGACNINVGGNSPSTISGSIQLNQYSSAYIQNLNLNVTNTGAVGPDLVIGSLVENPTYPGTPVVKNGPGTVAITGASSYTGPTIINAGTLLINGSLTGPDAVTINSGGFLGGVGTFNSSQITNAAGGTLAPGPSFGILSITTSGSLTLNAGSTNTFEVNGSGSADSVALDATSTLMYGGTLKILNSGTFTVGQTFTLFSGTAATSASNFANLVSTNNNVQFSFTNGVLSVVSIAPSPARLTNSVSGGVLSLSWPAGQGWRLQAQTNSLTGAWTTITGSSVSSASITVNPAARAVFYRLVYP